MRILVLTGSQQAAENEACRNSNPRSGATVSLKPTLKIRKGDTEVVYMVVKNQRDAESLRGIRFDLLIEDSSFNPERSMVKHTVLELVRMIVLR